jgi:hypothetical protein
MLSLTLRESFDFIYIISPACLDDEQELGHRFLVEVTDGFLNESLMVDLTISSSYTSVIDRAIKDELGEEYYVSQIWEPRV